MSVQQPSVNIGWFVAGEDLSNSQFFYVILNASGEWVLPTAVTDAPGGVLQNQPLQGEVCNVMVVGVTKLSASGALAINDFVGTNATGQAEAKVPGVNTTEYIAGRILEATTAQNELATATVNTSTVFRAA